MQGQISIDYLAGAMIFFGALVLLVSNVMTTLPEFSDAQRVDQLQLSAWAASEVMVNDRGYWDNGTINGTSWQDHVDDVEVAGLEGPDGDLLMAKIEAMTAMDDDTLQDAVATNESMAVSFREVVSLDTHRAFEQGSAPGFITEPSYDPDADSTVHYGATDVHGTRLHVLLTDVVGWYNHVYISRDWDFTNVNTETFNLTETGYLQLAERTYAMQSGHTDLSEGRMLLMSNDLGRAGPIPPQDVTDIVTVERYGVVDGNVMEVRVQAWQ